MISLTAEQWRRAEVLVSESLDRAPDDRARMLDLACANDRDLRRVVDELLQAASEDSFLEDSPRQPRELFKRIDDDPWIGRQLGAYRLSQPIGEGGMGRVFLAERVDGVVEQRVAVKVLGTSEPVRVRMLRREMQILARLEHPKIARFLDEGRTHEGQPFVVMEYVEGLPIVEYCERRQFSARQRVELFLEVCEAVEYAHRQLVIHRDLKPSHILVDASGSPKLLDFGIAKLLGHSEQTLPQERFLTPAFASPEQRRGDPVSIASDVYSLGVVLCDLLTGELPSREDPERGSSSRGLPAMGLGKSHEEDLRAIIDRCLKPEPADRYLSVTRLIDDLERYLAGHPVMARSGGFGYRLRKFLGRHRLPVVLAAVAILALVALTFNARFQSQRFQRERDLAEAARMESREITEVLLESIRRADPYQLTDATREVTVRQLLDETADRVQDGLSDRPLVQANLLHTLALVYADLGRPQKAVELFRRGFELRRDTVGWSDIRVAKSLNGLGFAYRDAGEARAALMCYRTAAALAGQLGPEDSHPRAEGLRGTGLLLFEDGQHARALEFLEDSLAVRRRLVSEDHRVVAITRMELADVYRATGDFYRAELSARQSLESLKLRVGETHPDVATAQYVLASTLVGSGEITEALALSRRALTIRQSLQGETHPETRSTTRELAGVLIVAGEFDEAETLLRRVLQADQNSGSARAAAVARTQSLLGDLLRRRGELPAARSALVEAIESLRELHGESGGREILPQLRLAQVMDAMGDANAEQALREVDRRARVAFGVEHPTAVETTLALAEYLAEAGHCGPFRARVLAVVDGVVRTAPGSRQADRARRLAERCGPEGRP